MKAMRIHWTDTGQNQIRSPACILSQHQQCPHIHGYGLAPKLRRPHLQAIAQLCTCECHSSCPVTGKHMPLREQTWRESCTCPGAEDERAKRDQ